MRLYGDLTDAEVAAHLLVQTPANDERHDLPFSWSERVVSITQLLQDCVLVQSGPTSL